MIKKIRIKVLVPLIVIGLLAAYVIGVYVVTPIYTNIEHDKFISLDSQMKTLFRKLEGASGGTDTWKYSAVCSADRTGWMATGKYNCITSISIKKTIDSVQELNDLQAKYYPIIDGSGILKSTTELDPQLPNDFGKRFVVSSAEKRYVESKTNIGCRYIIQLDQVEEKISETAHNYEYSSNIEGANGSLLISFRCDETANDHWYELVSSTSNLIP